MRSKKFLWGEQNYSNNINSGILVHECDHISRSFDEYFDSGHLSLHRYEITWHNGNLIGVAKEVITDRMNKLSRMFLGISPLLRNFEIHFFDKNNNFIFYCVNKRGGFGRRFEVRDKKQRLLGAVYKYFAILPRKRLHIENEKGEIIYKVNSPWINTTFSFQDPSSSTVAEIKKLWPGIFTEATDNIDSFHLDFSDKLPNDIKPVLLAAIIFIDINYYSFSARGRMMRNPAGYVQRRARFRGRF